ncbi:MAG: ring,2-phenylacetyl-CoA epoxidase subunit PaaD [Frankiaceae bacterium]|nr:ring,2-phenylacetyl-CoA epoxidase subunit PaaD [Frankiaceae bacterium]
MTAAVDDVRAVLSGVTDPEIPVLTLEDLGVLRDVTVDGDRVVVTVTPTYSGCPAMDEIRADIRTALADHGWRDVEVRTVLSPAWTTDDLTETGRRRLREFGIAPPAPRADGPVLVPLGRRPVLACPQCGSTDTEELARFGSTSCKALWRCRSCREPFDHFKAH